MDTYPLPLVQDILASLVNGQSFSKLELAQAYQQLTLDEESCKYTTINTHKGLFQYTRLPFGVDKRALMIPEVEYLGHSISAEGGHPVKEKVHAVFEAPRPQNVSQLRSFIGMVNYYAKFLSNLAMLLRPLYNSLQTAKRRSTGAGFSKGQGTLIDCTSPHTL